ncbi:CHASE2 domain-containing protein [Schlegelella sp. S2-27]|uniref:histidine kinase n=1 Tax=Caldimonas mangrovi TaxID=2944811 RepID=A0ABT0YP11_9BURK|nr:CHASE2 domain-containing protein [Caldimonas mangrovi]MCM5680470.1 CHASE2 domain-containing protein [Caldimonas mangrovi]
MLRNRRAGRPGLSLVRVATLPAPVAALARWGILWVAVALVAGIWGYANGTGRVENAFVDHLRSMTERPAPTDIVIVGIDDRSLAALGRWPWRRRVHAALIERLQQAGARAIGLDLILSESNPQQVEDDILLAHAIGHAGNVVLPLHAQWLGSADVQPALPSPPLRAAARGVGHIHVELGQDGVARSVFLREGTGTQHWDHWTVALMQAAGEAPPGRTLPGVRRPPAAHADGRAAGGTWQRDHWIQIPFAGPPGHFARLSYVDVLEGRVPAEALRGKYVLIGATAAGMGDAYLTPMASQDSLMPGVEVSANVLDSLRRNIHLRRATPWENALFCLVPVVLAMAALYRLQPRWAFCTVVALVLLVYVLAWAALKAPGVQFAPLAALGCLALIYPMWGWFRLEAVTDYLAKEFRQMQREDKLLTALPVAGRGTGDELDRRMLALTTAAEQLRGLLRFVRDSIDSLADVVLVADPQGRVLLANEAAARYFSASVQQLQDRDVDALFADRLRLPDRSPLPPVVPVVREQALERHVVDVQQRDLLLKCLPRRAQDGTVVGSIVSLVDISAVQQVQRQREEALRFISHDMRAPQSSILTLIELQRLDPVPDPQVFERIEAHARRTLALADDFVHLARAQSDAYEFTTVDLCDVIVDAADRFWDQARARGVEIVTEASNGPCMSRADRDLLTRAVANLVDNALKYGPRGGRITCALQRDGDRHVISVKDEGPGIAQDQQASLFEQFKRLGRDTRTSGAGLGLAFVQAVVTRHRGTVWVCSLPGAGAEFRMSLQAVDVLDSLPALTVE